MCATDQNSHIAGPGRSATAQRKADAGGRRTSAARLAAFKARLAASDGRSLVLERAAEELSRVLGSVVVFTTRGGPDDIVVEAEARPPGVDGAPSLAFLRGRAECIARRVRVLGLSGAAARSTGLPPGYHYLGFPSPRRPAAAHAIHVISASPFTPAQRQTARAAADVLGEWMTKRYDPDSLGDAETAIAGIPGESVAAAELGIEQLLSDAMRAAAETLSADTCSFMVMDEAKGALVVDAAYGLDEGIVRDRARRTGEGIADYVMSLGEPVILDDPQQDPRLRGLAIERRPDIKCSICVPVALPDGFRGMVSFNRTASGETFKQDDLHLAVTVASQLGPCFANARLYQQAAERIGEMAAISRITEAITPAMGLQRAAEIVVAGIAQATGVERCRLYLIEGERTTLAAAHGYGESTPAPLEDADEVAARAAQEGGPIIVHSAGADPQHASASERRRSASLPVTYRGQARGVLCLDFDDDECLARLDVTMLEKILARAAVILDNASVHERLRENLDDLYRLYDSVQRINTSFEPEDILNQTAHEVKLLTGCRRIGFTPLELDDELAGEPSALPTVLRLAPDSNARRAARNIGAPLLVNAQTVAPPAEIADLASEVRRMTGAGRTLIVPLAHERGNLGLLLGWSFAREPSARELSLAAGLCVHGAALLRKALDYRAAISERSLELSALYRLCEEISAATSFESALRSVLEIAHSMVPYDEGLVFIWSQESARLELAACRGVDYDAISAQAPQAAPGNMYQWVYGEGKAFISTDIGQHRGEGAAGQVLRSSMAVPLVVGNETFGVLAIHSARPRAYTEEHVKMLSIVASQAAAIYRALQSLGSLSRYTDSILQSMVAGVIGLDRAGKIVIWSPAAQSILETGAAEAVGCDFMRLAHGTGRGQAGAAGRSLESLGMVAQRVLAYGEPVLEHELRLERSGAPPRAVLASCTPLRAADGELMGAVLLVEDITERKRMDDRMRQMSQLAAVGHLAANVAHEIRNPLSAIKTAAQFLSTEYGRDPLIAQFSGIIDEECDRLGKVATDFLTYARPNEPALERVSVATVVEGALAATAREMNERNVTVEWRAAKTLPRVWADPEAMRQAFVNLLINAAQAIGSDGQITVEVRSRRAQAGGRSVEIVITDTGPGISEENMERIWTPFFSTKAKGTGLGLSIVRKTVEAHGGQVWAKAPHGGGAVFCVRLPLDRARAPAAVAAATRMAAPGAPGWRQLDLFDEGAAQVSERTPAAAEGRRR
jgi:two-component system nitrogen regulation sensor histidine kinase GlnL